MKRRTNGLIGTALLAAGAIVMTVWILSARLQLVYDHKPAHRTDADWMTGIIGGSLFMTYHPSHQFGGDNRWSCGPRYARDTRFYWWFSIWQPDDLGGGYYYTMIPLWSIGLPMLAAGGASLVARRRADRRDLAGRCCTCNYDLTGITGPCPECGKGRTT